jgi:hypothetical protein
LHRELEGALEARFKLTGKNFSVQVFDLNEGEEYLPFDWMLRMVILCAEYAIKWTN